jgi:hypothetical protein
MSIYSVTTYVDHGTEREAVKVSWKDVRKTLGHEHEGNERDDTALVTRLIKDGAPEWVKDASGGLDEDGWYLFGPRVILEGDFALVPAPNASQRWVEDDEALPHVYQRVEGGAAIALEDGTILDVYVTLKAARDALGPAIKAARDDAKRRSGAEWL